MTNQASSDPMVKGQGLKAKKARYRIRKYETQFPGAVMFGADHFPAIPKHLTERYVRAKAYLVTLALLKD